MISEQEMICKLLDTMEAAIDNDVEFSSDELEEFVVYSITAQKLYGRHAARISKVIDMLEGMPIGLLVGAGLTYEDYRNTYHLKPQTT